MIFLVILVTLLTGTVYADDAPVHFADDLLKAAVEEELQVYDPTPDDMLNLVVLIANDTPRPSIVDLSGLEYASHLQRLNLRFNSVNDITPLQGLVHLDDLNLSQNNFADISPLSTLTALRHLNLHANKISDLSPLRNLLNVTWLDLHWNNLSDLSPLESLPQLVYLSLWSNEITDISPLANLVNLQTLRLFSNQVNDLSPLQNMARLSILEIHSNKLDNIETCQQLTSLNELSARQNRIVDISPLAFHPSLTRLRLEKNRIRDISPLITLNQLRTLELSSNPLNDDAYEVDLDAIVHSNPNVTLTYDPYTDPPSYVSATQGLYPDKVHITWLSVHNGPNYTSHYRVSRSTSEHGTKSPISSWLTDTTFIDTSAEPGVHYYWIQMDYAPEGDEMVSYSDAATGWILETASVPLFKTLYVDSNAIDDPNQDGSTDHPFTRIQAAIDTATEGDCVRVRQGLYPETIDFLGKNLTVTSMDPCDPTRIEFPVIQGGVHDVAVQFTHGEDPNCRLEGFVISQGKGALLCDSSSPTITHCLIIGNQSPDPNQATITCRESQAWFDHCTITDNRGTGLLLSNSDIIVSNSIVWGNLPDDIILNGTSEPRILYSNITHPWEDLGNISEDPLFARLGQWESDPNDYWIPGVYHLQSAAGRWDPTTTQWPLDADTSPCIDAGDPNSPWLQETEPHGEWANIGAYGNTAQASHSPKPVGDDDTIYFADDLLKAASPFVMSQTSPR